MTNSISKWQVQESRMVLDATPFMTVRQEAVLLPSGLTLPDYYVITEPDIVIVLAITEQDEIILVEQYKHGIGEICLEVPGGLSDGGDPLDEIKRELREETGYESENWQPLATYISNPTRIDNRIYAYVARDARKVTEQHLDPAEAITVHMMPIAQVLQAIQVGRISAVHSIAVIFQWLATQTTP